MHEPFDVLICGAGMVGSALGIALSSLPLRIAIIDANPLQAEVKPSSDGRSIALTYGSRMFFDQIGVWSGLQELAIPIEKVHVSQRGSLGVTRISALEQDMSALGYVVPAPILGTQIIKVLLEKSHANTNSTEHTIKVINPATLTAIEKHEALWQVALKTAQETKTITAKLLVAADGTHSSVRDLLHMTSESKDYQESAIATQVGLARSHQNIAFERFTDKGVIAMLPLKGFHCGCVWTGSSEWIEQLSQLSDAEYLPMVQRYFGYRLGPLKTLGKRFVYPLSQVFMSKQVDKGLVFVGNAAHTIHPLAAQGFNLGLGDVQALTTAVQNCLQAQLDVTDVTMLQNYAKQRQQQQQTITQFTNNLVSLFASDFFPLSIMRSAGLFALNRIIPLKKRLARQLMGIAE